LAAPVFAEQKVNLKIAYENKIQFPYYMGQTSHVLKKNPGVAVEMIQKIPEKIDNISLELHRFPWKRCLESLKYGTVDGIFNSSFKEDRLDFGVYPFKNGRIDTSRRITTIAYSLYKLKNNNLSWNGEKFINLDNSIGVPFGYSIIGDLEKMGINADDAGGTIINLRKLMAGRVQGVVLQDVTADYYIRTKKEFRNIVKVSPPVKVKPYYLMLSKQFVKKYPDLSEKIWDAVRQIRQEDFESISRKYLNGDYELN